MPYFGGIFFANMEGGGGQNYFQSSTDYMDKFVCARELALSQLDLDQLELDQHLVGSSPASFELT